MKCGGSDGFSGITANPTVGRFSDILISKKCPLDTVYVLADPEFVGVMPVRQDVQVIPADKPELLRVGWIVYEEIGLSVVNPLGVSKIIINR